MRCAQNFNESVYPLVIDFLFTSTEKNDRMSTNYIKFLRRWSEDRHTEKINAARRKSDIQALRRVFRDFPNFGASLEMPT